MPELSNHQGKQVMNNKLQRATKVITLLLVCAVVQVYVVGNALAAPGTSALFGRVEVVKEKFINVNGNAAGSGTTIFSGAQLTTPEAVSAAVQLENLGRLEITPGTDLTVTFDKANVNVAVTKGYAMLTTKEGVKGTVTLPEGKAAPAAKASGAQTGGGTILGLSHTGAFVAGAIIFVTVVVTVIVVTHDNCNNPTPNAPCV
jgi:hypothetical protein